MYSERAVGMARTETMGVCLGERVGKRHVATWGRRQRGAASGRDKGAMRTTGRRRGEMAAKTSRF